MIDLMALMKWAWTEIQGEYQDDQKFTAAEGVEFVGLLLRKLSEEPACQPYKFILYMAGGFVLRIARQMGEDSQ